MSKLEVNAARRGIVRHALAIMLLGLIAGFGYTYAILGEFRVSPIPFAFMESFPGDPMKWRTLHLGCLLNGMMAIALTYATTLFSASQHQMSRIRAGILLAIWGNALFYALSFFAPNRGLSIGSNSLGVGNLAGTISYLVAFAGAVGLIVAIVTLIRLPAADKSQ